MVSKKEWLRDYQYATGEKKNTYEAIRKKMGGREASCKGAFDEIKKSDELDLTDRGIADLGPLAAFGHLTSLWLYDNDITDVGPLSNLTKLKSLGLRFNDITDVGPLSNLTNLKTLYLSNNKITDVGPLSNLTNLRELYLYRNKISDVGPLSNLTNLETLDLSNNKIQDFSPVAHVATVYGKDDQFLQDTLEPSSTSAENHCESPFYKKIIENDKSSINEKITKLIDLIEDVHQMKFFYTFVSNAYRMNEIEDDDRMLYIRDGIANAAQKTFDVDAFIIFKRILDKAQEDKIVDLDQFRRFDREAELTNTEHAPFIKELQQAVKSNTARIEGLEANVEAINKSVNRLKDGLKRKLAVESCVSFMSAILNAVSLGVAGSALQGAVSVTVGSIVDFGDISHIRQVASSCPTSSESVAQGESLGQNIANSSIADVIDLGLFGYEELAPNKKLDKSLNDINALTVIAAVAVALPSSNPQCAIPSGVDINGPPSDEEGSMGFSDDEEESIFELIDGNNIDELQTVIDGFETKDKLKEHFINDRHGEDRLNSLKYAVSKKNTKAVEIIGGKAKELGLINDRKMTKYMEEANTTSN